MARELPFDEVKECECNKHAQDSRGQCGGLTWPNVLWKQVRGTTMTDKEISYGEDSMVQKQAEKALASSL